MLKPADIMRIPAPIAPPIAPAIKAGAVALACDPLHHGFGSRELGQKRLRFVRRIFLGQKVEDDANRFFRSRPIYADIGHQTCDQLLHITPSCARSSGGLCILKIQMQGDKAPGAIRGPDAR
jgi:hypothetical protein